MGCRAGAPNCGRPAPDRSDPYPKQGADTVKREGAGNPTFHMWFNRRIVPMWPGMTLTSGRRHPERSATSVQTGGARGCQRCKIDNRVTSNARNVRHHFQWNIPTSSAGALQIPDNSNGGMSQDVRRYRGAGRAAPEPVQTL